ncbi:hypothetical protein L4D76_13065 [Photobacterium sagamiensis]|uniref:hypothetical protein n=1 Tax=Photobacterium sagamiensis TaxID=2910241 RepID=UPI003D0C5EC7
MKKLTAILTILSIMFITACSYKLDESSIPPESQDAIDYMQLLIDNDIENFRSNFNSELFSTVTEEELHRVTAFIPGGELLSTKVISWNIRTVNSVWHGNFTLEYQFTSGWAVAQVSLDRIGGNTVLNAFRFTPTKASLEELNSFSAVTPTLDRILIVILTFASPIFMVITCYSVYKTPMPVKKWKWYLLSFLGFGAVTMNWTTGVINFQLLTVQLVGFGAGTGTQYAPWMFKFTVPVSAMIFWMRRKKYIEQAKANTTTPSTEEQSAD